MPSSKPSIAELRRVCQPERLMSRRSAEHWAGRLYMRRLSLHVTRLLIDAPVSPNALTVWMLVVGVVGAVAAAVPGVVTAIVAALLIQAYLLLDCVDGEVARWRGATSTAGVYLDRLGHYSVEAALLVGLGVRASGGDPLGTPWPLLGALAAVFVLLSKAETDLVVLARASAGLDVAEERDPTSSSAPLRGARSMAARLPLHRIVGAIELSLLLVVAAIVDAVAGDLLGTRALLGVAVVIAAVVAVLHPVMILTSKRLR